jgi:hypothetical protein
MPLGLHSNVARHDQSTTSMISVEAEAVNIATADLSRQLVKEGISVDDDVRKALARQVHANVAKYMESSRNLMAAENFHSKDIAKEALGLTNVTSLKILARKVKQHKREKMLNSVTVPKWWIILPSNRFKLTWDLANVLLIIYSIFEMPFSMAFGTVNDCDATWLENVNLFIDCCFCTDSMLNFFTAYVDYETSIVVVDSVRIIKRSVPHRRGRII